MIPNCFRRIAPWLGPLAALAALWLLSHVLREYHLSEIITSLRAIPSQRIAAALLLTAVGYLAMTGYDALALGYARQPLPYRKLAPIAFIGYAFSNSVGFALLSGGALRYRYYVAQGVDAAAVAKVVAFNQVTFFLGLLTTAGLALILDPPRIFLAHRHLSPVWLQCGGAACVLLMCAYLFLICGRKRAAVIKGVEIPSPSRARGAAQVLLSSADWLCAAGALWVLLPAGAPLGFFLGCYFLAQIAGLLSNVPGGLGVFETILVLALSAYGKPPQILGALAAFRAVYYLLPFCLAVLMVSVIEACVHTGRAAGLRRAFGVWAPRAMPVVLAVSTFAAGMVLLFSGATPSLSERMLWLQALVPSALMEASHFLGSIVGVCLLLLAQGLLRRLDGAYVLSIVCLCLGILFSLLKAFDYEEALVLTIMLLALLPAHRYFYRKASLLNEPLSMSWLVASGFVLFAAAWLGFFAHQHITYSHELWWQFSLNAHAPRFLRATAGAFVVLLIWGLRMLLHPPSAPFSGIELAAAHVVQTLVEASPETYANLALLGDKRFLLNRAQDAFVMYGVSGRSWVALGDPVGNEDSFEDLVWRFRELCDHYQGWAIFYQVKPEHLHLYLDLGLSLYKLGEEARVELSGFSVEGGSRKSFRRVLGRIQKEGYRFEIITPADTARRMAELKSVSEAWLSAKQTREKRFSLGSFDEQYLSNFACALVTREGQVTAFANLWEGAGKEELSLDLMRYLPESPNGIMDYLFVELMLWGRSQGFRWFSMGMAPLAGMADHALAPLWSKIGARIFRHGENFYNFKGLRGYKDKFDPIWEPRYLAAPGGLVLPRVLVDTATLISGSLKGVVGK